MKRIASEIKQNRQLRAWRAGFCKHLSKSVFFSSRDMQPYSFAYRSIELTFTYIIKNTRKLKVGRGALHLQSQI